jgi:CheY-like chemotaxis protein
LVKAVVEAARGRVWVSSDVGRGSTFFFTLPLARSPEARRAPVVRSQDTDTTDVLLVEDDASYSRLLVEHLENTGLSVVTTSRAEHALTLLAQTSPRVVLTDLQLAGTMDGWDFLIAVKKMPGFQTTPILVISATETRVRGLALDGAECILKPVPPQGLLEAIHRYLPRLRGKKVLVADDDPRFRTEIVELLRDRGVHVEEAPNGQAALGQLGQRLPDLLILDLLMPEVDGFGVLRRLRQDRKAVNLPVIVTTGMDLLPAQQAYVKRRLGSLVSKKDESPECIARVVQQLTRERHEEDSSLEPLHATPPEAG